VRSRTRLDAVGALATRPFAITMALAAPVLALVLTLAHPDQTRYPALMVVAIGVLAFASAVLIRETGSGRVPFGALTHATVVVLAAIAALLSAIAQGSANTYLRDDWGPLALAIILLASGPYRPVRELYLVSAVSVVFLVFVALGQSSSIVWAMPITCVVIVTMPVIALSAGATAFASSAVLSRERWEATAMADARAAVADLREPIERAVRQDRVAILNWDVTPFFGEILERGELTEADRERAASISRSIRGVMVAEADRSWLESLVNELAPHASFVGEIRDAARLTDAMTISQRTAVRALVAGLTMVPGPALTGISATASLGGNGTDSPAIEVQLSAALAAASTPFRVRSTLRPFVAVMRLEFDAVTVTLTRTQLTLRFSYEQ